MELGAKLIFLSKYGHLKTVPTLAPTFDIIIYQIANHLVRKP